MIKEFWIATDRNGGTYMFKQKPLRVERMGWWTYEDPSKYGDFKLIPDMTVEFILGKLVKWEDEPVKIKIEY